MTCEYTSSNTCNTVDSEPIFPNALDEVIQDLLHEPAGACDKHKDEKGDKQNSLAHLQHVEKIIPIVPAILDSEITGENIRLVLAQLGKPEAVDKTVTLPWIFCRRDLVPQMNPV